MLSNHVSSCWVKFLRYLNIVTFKQIKMRSQDNGILKLGLSLLNDENKTIMRNLASQIQQKAL